jgi:hypothetical protein
MSPEAELRYRIRRAERLLPGRPAPKGKTDWRWQAIGKMERFVETQPEPIWEFINKWGRHPQADLRTAIGVILLERLLDQHFSAFIDRVETAVRESKRFKDTLGRAYWIGEAAWPPNARRLDALAGIKRQRIHPRKPA